MPKSISKRIFKKKNNLYCGLRLQSPILPTYVDNGVAIDEPHDTGSRVSCHSCTEASRLSLLNSLGLRLRHEYGGFLGLLVFYHGFWCAGKRHHKICDGRIRKVCVHVKFTIDKPNRNRVTFSK